MRQRFEEIDLKGLALLENEPFREYKEMVFRASAYDPRAIEELLSRNIPRASIQFQLNHQSLISYGGDIAQQMQAAEAVRAAWQPRLVEQFPNLYPWVLVESSPQEVIVSLRVVVR